MTLESRSQHSRNGPRQTPHLRGGVLATYGRGREGPRVVGYKGHLGAIKALLEENLVLEVNEHLRVFVESRVVGARMVLRLGGWAADALTLTSPVLFRRNTISGKH